MGARVVTVSSDVGLLGQFWWYGSLSLSRSVQDFAVLMLPVCLLSAAAAAADEGVAAAFAGDPLVFDRCMYVPFHVCIHESIHVCIHDI